MTDNAAVTRRFRMTAFALIGLGVLAAIAFKAWHVSAAFQNWEGQQIQHTPGAAR